jgi:hypothetical protein
MPKRINASIPRQRIDLVVLNIHEGDAATRVIFQSELPKQSAGYWTKHIYPAEVREIHESGSWDISKRGTRCENLSGPLFSRFRHENQGLVMWMQGCHFLCCRLING